MLDALLGAADWQARDRFTFDLPNGLELISLLDDRGRFRSPSMPSAGVGSAEIAPDHGFMSRRASMDIISRELAPMIFAFPPIEQPTLPIAGSDLLFPVHRVYCIGRNYAEHAREMGHDPDREPPFFFQKNPDNLKAGGIFSMPAHSNDVQFEIELAVCLKSGGTNIAMEYALDHVFGYAAVLDMTRRDLQAEAKKLGRPWEVAKAFEGSAPCSAVHRVADVGHPAKGEISLDQNGKRRQTGDLSQMIWSVPEQISILSRYFGLRAGDVILTGTPAGVGRVEVGDRLAGRVAGVGGIEIQVI